MTLAEKKLMIEVLQCELDHLDMPPEEQEQNRAEIEALRREVDKEE